MYTSAVTNRVTVCSQTLKKLGNSFSLSLLACHTLQTLCKDTGELRQPEQLQQTWYPQVLYRIGLFKWHHWHQKKCESCHLTYLASQHSQMAQQHADEASDIMLTPVKTPSWLFLPPLQMHLWFMPSLSDPNPCDHSIAVCYQPCPHPFVRVCVHRAVLPSLYTPISLVLPSVHQG